MSSHVFGYQADIGDAIAFLPTVRALGGGKMVFGFKPGPNRGRESMKGARFEALKPLLDEQAYFYGTRWNDNFDGMTIDATGFRSIPRLDGENLAQWQARYSVTTISEEPWLTAEPDERYRGRTVIARSLRYHEPGFPWPQMMRENPDALFVGLPDEHAAFQHRYGPIEHLPTGDFWELACVMAAAKLVISNQTAAFWVAIGLGVDTVQETWSHSRDSIITRPNARYFYHHEPRPASRRQLLKA